MWTLEDASRVGASDMDRRACPSYDYEAGFDACDPLGTVLECSGRGPARVLRRRCRSEGVDRSPFEDATPHHSPDDLVRQQRILPNKSFYTMKSAFDSHYHKYLEECILPSSVTGDHAMTHESRQNGHHQQGRTKYHLSPPTRPLLLTTLSNTKVEDQSKVDGTRLPKVEELFEKTDHEMMEVPHVPVTKQPLKSILNNPLPPKSPPPGILKKPKTKGHQDVKSNIEGRRRQRASSESDNLYCGYHTSSPADGGCSSTDVNNCLPQLETVANSLKHFEAKENDSFCLDVGPSAAQSYVILHHVPSDNTNLRTSFLKRAKDNSGTGYSYGSALATLSRSPINRSPTNLQRNRASIPKEINSEELHHMTLLRTTAIKNDVVEDDCIEELLQHDSPTPASTAITPALPVSSVTSVTVPVAKKALKVARKKKYERYDDMKLDKKLECITSEEEPEDASRSPSPDGLADSWKMETDGTLAAGEKHDKPSVPPLQLSILNFKKEQEVIESKAPSKSTTKINGVVNVPIKKSSSKDAHVIPDYILNSLRPSLFPRVPPYLKFINHDESPALRVPMCIQKHLKWKLTTITPIVVKKTLTNSGFRLVKSECDTAECPQEETVDWIGIWGKHMKSLMFRAIKEGQKMNHFPGTFQIGRKDRLWRNLQKLSVKYGIKEFGIMPKTYVLPHDLKLLKHDWEKHSENNEKWIIKPPASARGTGIKVVSRWTQIPKKRPVVVQKYVSKPYLINGNKFDMRLYVLVTSVHPLRIYLYKDGLARFASVKYNDEVGSLNDRYMHLTNYSINRLSKNYTPNEDFAACEGHKWTLQTLFTYLKTEKRVDTKALWESMKDLVIKTIISGEGSISSLTKANITSRYNCYELFGVDVLLDENLKPWLLEVNISPSLHSASPLDIHVKGPLVTTVLNIAQFQVPIKTNLELLSREKPHKLNGLPYDSRLYTIYLSKEERDKHIIYTNMEDRDIYIRDILSTLTPDDVRHLIQAEDELTQTGPDMERIFPNTESHKYLNYLTGPRYYNRLFDAWETRYGHNRSPGIELLRNLCDIGYHLEVPPVPLKNDVDAPSPPVSARPSVPSLASLEPTGSAASVPSASRVCGDALAHPHPHPLAPAPAPPPLQPRA